MVKNKLGNGKKQPDRGGGERKEKKGNIQWGKGCFLLLKVTVFDEQLTDMNIYVRHNRNPWIQTETYSD